MKPKLLMQTFLSFALMTSLILPVAYGQTDDWVEWRSNPIVEGDYPSVLYDPDRFSGHGDAATYKMWTDQDLKYFTSKNGIKWKSKGNANAGLTGMVSHPLIEYYPGSFEGVDSGKNRSNDTMYYRLWYWNEPVILNFEAICYAESPDGVNWYNNQPIAQDPDYPDAPLMITGNTEYWNAGSYGPADVLYNPDAKNSGTDWVFTMYYDGTDLGDESLGIAFSKDGIHWIGHDTDGDDKADPVLVGGDPDDWDGGDRGYVSRATVLNIDGQYRMWYSGGQTDMNDGIGYAESSDGLVWSKSPDPIFHIDDPVTWRTDRTFTPMVIYDPDAFCGHGQAYRYKMWFSGEDLDEVGRIGYAVGGDPSLDCFDIHHTRVLRPKRKRNDQIFVLQATFWTEIPESADAPVIFALDDKELVNVSFGDFSFKDNRYIYQHSEVGRASIEMTLDFDNGTLRLTVNDVDLSDLGREVEFRLIVGDFIGSLDLKMRKKKDGLYYLKKNGN